MGSSPPGRGHAPESLHILRVMTHLNFRSGATVLTAIVAATVISDTLAVFENPAHDFPQRIAYVRVHADSVVARISAAKDGRERGMAIPMGRRACAP